MLLALILILSTDQLHPLQNAKWLVRRIPLPRQEKGLGWVGWVREGKGGGDINNKEHTDQSWTPMLMMSVLISDRGI